jgi:predicted DNA-binding protein YlxM (UPF0122 family)
MKQGLAPGDYVFDEIKDLYFERNYTIAEIKEETGLSTREINKGIKAVADNLK